MIKKKGWSMINKLFKNKKKRHINLLLVILPFILLIGVFGFVALSSAKSLIGNGSTPSGISNSIESMDYHLRNGATELQKEYFKELSDLCSAETKDKEEIAKSVVKNYIADFYTWTNKAGSYDVGGLYYVHSPSKSNIYANARNNFYKYLTNYIAEYKSENLLEVESVEVEGNKLSEPYNYNGVNYDAYYYHATWKYVNHSGFDNSDYLTSQNFLVIENQDGRFEIVQAYGD